MILLLFCDWPTLAIVILALLVGEFCGFATAALCVAGSDAHLEENHTAERCAGCIAPRDTCKACQELAAFVESIEEGQEASCDRNEVV